LYSGAQARAYVSGRDYVLPDDVKYLAPFVLAHRVILSSEARLRGRAAEEVIAEVAQRVPVPVEAV
jgi:MoxR-like ATPase